MKKKSKYVIGWFPVILLLLVCPLSGQAQDYLQKRINVDYQNATMRDVLKDLTQKTGVEFLYNQDEVKQVKLQTFKMEQVSLTEVLDHCFRGTKLGFKYVDGMIVITLLKGAQVTNLMKITGKVTSNKGEPLIGATITLKGSTIGVAADVDGNYVLNVPHSKDMILLVSFIGMKTKEVKILPDETVYNVQLEDEDVQVEDVVVTGYANIRKSSFTGNTVRVMQDELKKVASRNLIVVLQNFDPSLRIQENSEWGSDPNALPEFYIRGRSGIGVKDLDRDNLSKSSLQGNPNLPLFIMDGFEVSVEKIYDFDMSRVASVEILKDAAATAMYGSRGANGVVVVTTLAPQPGKLRVSYNFDGALTAPDLSDYNLMNAAEKLNAEFLAGCYDAEGVGELLKKQQEYNLKMYNVQRGVDTYWLSKPLRTIFNHKHSVYVEGGSDNLRFGVDLKYDNQDGVMKGSFRDRMGAGFSLDYRFKRLQIKNYISYNVTKSKESPYGTFRDYTEKQPYDEYKDEMGNYLKETKLWHDGSNTNLKNPLYEATLGSFDRSSYRELLDNISVNWYIMDGLQLKGEFSVTKKDSKSDKFTDPKSSTYDYLQGTDLKRGELSRYNAESVEWNLNAVVMYNKLIDKHSINFTLGVNAVDKSASNETALYKGFPSAEMWKPAYAYEIVTKPTFDESASRLFGALSFLNYSYNDIYLLDLSCRFDGSSEFGTDKKFAPFWSSGIGVNVHNYKYIKEHLPNLDIFKIRATYGQTGKVNFAPFEAQTMYTTYTKDWYSTGFGAIIQSLGNNRLKWEKTNTWDLGFDLKIYRGALDMRFSYYNKKTVDLVTDVAIPSSSGFSSYKDNLGEVRNEGVEVSLKTMILNRGDLLVSVYANIAHNKNEILKISESLAAYNDKVNEYYKTKEVGRDYSKALTKYVPGGSLTSIFGMRSLGIDPATGDELFLKNDGTTTYTWDPTETVVIGNTEPDAQGSFGLNVVYKNFFLYCSFMYEFGGQRYNYTLVNDVENADVYNYNVDKRVSADRWQKEGDISPLKDIRDRDITTNPTSRFIQDYNVLALNSLSIGYDFNPAFVKPIGLSMLRLQFNMGDVVRFSSVKQERGLSYPYARTFNISLNASF